MSILTGCPALFRLAVVFFQYRRAVVKQALGSPYLPPIAWAIVRMKAFGVSKLSRLAQGYASHSCLIVVSIEYASLQETLD
jgi:hypothetical protein